MAAFFRKSKYFTISSQSAGIPGTAPFQGGALPHNGMSQEIPKRRDIPEGLWEKCKKCDEIIFTQEKESNLNICPKRK